MSKTEDEIVKELAGSVNKIEEHLQLPKHFMASLLGGDDWSFVIKAHAAIEAVVTHMLVAATKEQELISVFEMLELSNPRTGKVAFLDRLGLIDSPQKRFIRTFSELRNSLVHDIRNVSFTFDNHIASLDSNQKKQWKAAFGYYGEYQKTQEAREKDFEGAIANPKSSIWWGVFIFTLKAYDLTNMFKSGWDKTRIVEALDAYRIRDTAA